MQTLAALSNHREGSMRRTASLSSSMRSCYRADYEEQVATEQNELFKTLTFEGIRNNKCTLFACTCFDLHAFSLHAFCLLICVTIISRQAGSSVYICIDRWQEQISDAIQATYMCSCIACYGTIHACNVFK